MQTIEVNALGPFLTTRALPNLKLASKANGSAIVLQISSILGSISSNKDEYAQFFRGQYGYTTSKAALKMITRSLAMDLAHVGGHVSRVDDHDRDVAFAHHQGVLQPADSVTAMANIVSKLSLKDAGKFLNPDPSIPAAELPW